MYHPIGSTHNHEADTNKFDATTACHSTPTAPVYHTLDVRTIDPATFDPAELSFPLIIEGLYPSDDEIDLEAQMEIAELGYQMVEEMSMEEHMDDRARERYARELAIKAAEQSPWRRIDLWAA